MGGNSFLGTFLRYRIAKVEYELETTDPTAGLVAGDAVTAPMLSGEA